MIFYHTFNIKSFQSYCLVFAYQFKREFVLEIISLICNFIMELRKSLFGFSSTVRTFFLSTSFL